MFLSHLYVSWSRPLRGIFKAIAIVRQPFGDAIQWCAVLAPGGVGHTSIAVRATLCRLARARGSHTRFGALYGMQRQQALLVSWRRYACSLGTATSIPVYLYEYIPTFNPFVSTSLQPTPALASVSAARTTNARATRATLEATAACECARRASRSLTHPKAT